MGMYQNRVMSVSPLVCLQKRLKQMVPLENRRAQTHSQLPKDDPIPPSFCPMAFLASLQWVPKRELASKTRLPFKPNGEMGGAPKWKDPLPILSPHPARASRNSSASVAYEAGAGHRREDEAHRGSAGAASLHENGRDPPPGPELSQGKSFT